MISLNCVINQVLFPPTVCQPTFCLTNITTRQEEKEGRCYLVCIWVNLNLVEICVEICLCGLQRQQ